jgi:hypothetical protein
MNKSSTVASSGISSWSNAQVAADSSAASEMHCGVVVLHAPSSHTAGTQASVLVGSERMNLQTPPCSTDLPVAQPSPITMLSGGGCTSL